VILLLWHGHKTHLRLGFRLHALKDSLLLKSSYLRDIYDDYDVFYFLYVVKQC